MRKINLRSSTVLRPCNAVSGCICAIHNICKENKSQRRETRLHGAAAASHLKELQ